ncbi:coproporphyrinogen III oxidase, partial [Psychroserpens mesophilus]|uniref:coproporphyrinogen III oxidase n=1 Tax=Psychroserpens mesophilus TaxID=325473 RepID=UPI003D65F983
EEDARHFHGVCRLACDAHDPEFYPEYKEKCDRYFWNAHRGESRGVGGLFFDYPKPGPDRSASDWYAFVTRVGDSFLDAYPPL